MEVTGYMLKEGLKMKSIELSSIQTLFNESLYKFPDEKKMSPQEVVAAIVALEEDISLLQTAQSYYNLNVKVTVNKIGKLSLEQAIKLVGGAGRVSKMWRTAAKGNTRDRWSMSNVDVRRKDEEIASPTIKKEEALQHAKNAERYASSLRSAIALGNTTTVEIDWIDESLFG